MSSEDSSVEESEARQWPWESDRGSRLLAVAQREFDTLVRTRSYAGLAFVYALLVIGIPFTARSGGYLPLVLDLLTPVEVFVPVLAFGFGVWTVLADDHRGELEVIRTYPISRTTYVLGAYLGRAVGLLLTLFVPLILVGFVVPVIQEPATSVLASHGTVDSPTYYARFVTLTGLYGLVTLALAMTVSSLVPTRRGGVAASVLAILVVVVGFDALVILGLGQDVVGPETLSFAVGLSPPGAFRGLVLETAVGGLVETGPPVANIPASVVGLVGWFVVGLGVAIFSAWSPNER